MIEIERKVSGPLRGIGLRESGTESEKGQEARVVGMVAEVFQRLSLLKVRDRPAERRRPSRRIDRRRPAE